MTATKAHMIVHMGGATSKMTKSAMMNSAPCTCVGSNKVWNFLGGYTVASRCAAYLSRQ